MHDTSWFRAAFTCIECANEVTVNVRQAVVDSQTGARCICTECHKPYRVTRAGATPIDATEDVAFIDAEGKPYNYPSRKDEDNGIQGNHQSR